MEAEPLSRLTRDLVVEVLSRVDDGPTLASVACACRGLRGAAKEEALWEGLCHGAWPSTMQAETKDLVSSMPGGFAKLYADSLPMLLYDRRRPSQPQKRAGGRTPAHGNGAGEPAAASDLDLVSFVDVYYRKKCVLSRVVHGVPARDSRGGAGSLSSHFKVLSTTMSSAGVAAGGGVETGAAPPSIPLEPKEEGGVGVLNWMLEEDLALSWVLVDVKSGRAVKLSGAGKPAAVQRNRPCNGDLVVRFGCPVPVEQHLVACGVADCVVISMCCQLSETEDSLRFTKIELRMEDGEGTSLGGHRSLVVLGRALCRRARTRNVRAVEEGYQAYVKDRKEMRERGKMSKEGVVEKLCAFSGIAVLLCLLCIVVF